MFLLILIVSTIVFAYLSYSGDSQSQETSQNKDLIEFNLENIRSNLSFRVDSLLETFNLEKSWIKTNNDTGTVLFTKTITIPADLSVSFVNKDLADLMHNAHLRINSTKDDKSGNINFSVYENSNDEKPIAIIRLIKNHELLRNASSIVLIFDNLEELSESERLDILNSPHNLSFVLPLDFEKIDVQSSIIESEKNYVLYFNVGNTENYLADFRTDMSDRQWMTKITSLSSEYPEASGIIFRNPDMEFEFEKKIRTQYLIYNENSFRDTLVKEFMPEFDDPGKVDELFTKIINRNNEGNKVQFYLARFSYNDFKSLFNKISLLKKRGYNFIDFKTGADLLREIKANKEKKPENE
ncbi:MAG: hypothetical protein OZ913_06290 [Ignavibacteriaceae bacterium]|jgi:hypothetical protein|nr:hypothetical protein [Ignavibacteria bacterium]MEB2329896.1 hypothetical protein [Ignavibacteriaceae bacterium]OQY77491.1 MAG: hypothetical protein B6D43_06215 [Ignavibacteriales bacterium UTCHB1]